MLFEGTWTYKTDCWIFNPVSWLWLAGKKIGPELLLSFLVIHVFWNCRISIIQWNFMPVLSEPGRNIPLQFSSYHDKHGLKAWKCRCTGTISTTIFWSILKRALTFLSKVNPWYRHGIASTGTWVGLFWFQCNVYTSLRYHAMCQLQQACYREFLIGGHVRSWQTERKKEDLTLNSKKMLF